MLLTTTRVCKQSARVALSSFGPRKTPPFPNRVIPSCCQGWYLAQYASHCYEGGPLVRTRQPQDSDPHHREQNSQLLVPTDTICTIIERRFFILSYPVSFTDSNPGLQETQQPWRPASRSVSSNRPERPGRSSPRWIRRQVHMIQYVQMRDEYFAASRPRFLQN